MEAKGRARDRDGGGRFGEGGCEIPAFTIALRRSAVEELGRGDILFRRRASEAAAAHLQAVSASTVAVILSLNHFNQ